jgi:membrane protease YdiL (CAAX protease family)
LSEPPLEPEAPVPPEVPPDPAPWGLRGALLVPGMVYAGQVVLSLLIGAFATAVLLTLDPQLASHPDHLRDAVLVVSILPVALASAMVAIALVYVSVSVIHRRPFLSSLGLTWPRGGLVARSAGLGAAVAAAGIALIAVFPPDPDTDFGGPLTRLVESGRVGYLIWGFLAVIVAPVMEEIVFRGYAFLGARRRLGPARAGALVTVLFVALHVVETGTYWPALAGIALMATVLIVIMQRTGSLVCCVAGHMGYNAALAAVSLMGTTT